MARVVQRPDGSWVDSTTGNPVRPREAQVIGQWHPDVVEERVARISNTPSQARPKPKPEPAPSRSSSSSSSSSSRSSGGGSSGSWANRMEALWNKHQAAVTPIVNRLSNLAKTQTKWAKQDRARWESEFKPLEDALIADAQTFATVNRQELEAGRAASTVGKSYQAEREAARRRLETYGVDPSQTRGQALDLGLRAQEAAAQAAAANTARRYVEDTGRNLRGQAIALGADTANRADANARAAANTNTAAGSLGNNLYNIGSSYLLGGGQLDDQINRTRINEQLGLQRLALAQEGLALDAADQAFRHEQYLANNDRSGTNIGSILTTGTQAALDFHNAAQRQQYLDSLQPTPTPTPTPSVVGGQGPATNTYNPSTTYFADGGLVPQYAIGGPVTPPPGMGGGSLPSQYSAPATPAVTGLPVYDNNGSVEGLGGPKDDLVPARLSPGEYVMPAEVVKWKGEEFFSKLRDKAREAKQEEMQKNPPQYALPVR